MDYKTYNPVVGCSKVSAGCTNCYAERMIRRFPTLAGYKEIIGKDGTRYRCGGPNGWDGRAHFLPHKIEQPFHWRRPRKIFVCSMGDLFHETITNEQIAAVFEVMAATPQHQYVVLTKRLHRAAYWFATIGATADHYKQSESVICMDAMLQHQVPIRPGSPDIVTQRKKWPLPNVIMCASVEDQPSADCRVPRLLQIPAVKRGISVEPMLEHIQLRHMDIDIGEFYQIDALTGRNTDMGRPCKDVNRLDLVICGAETGPGKRPFKDEWALDLRDQCKAAGVPFFFKKDGQGNGTLCGVEYNEWI